jgi:hypothetical protein
MSESNTSWPSKDEIIGLLNQRNGVVHVWKTLTGKYGSPKNSWGGFCRLVIREHKASSNAGIGTSINGVINAPASAQSNASNNALARNSGPKTGNMAEHSTLGIPMVMAREPDVIVQAHDLQPVKATHAGFVDPQLILDLYQYFRQPVQSPPPEQDLWDELDLMWQQTLRMAIRMCPYIAFLRAISQNWQS